MKPVCKILSCFALAILLLSASAAAASKYMDLADGAEKWFTMLGTDDTHPYRMHTVASTYPGGLFKIQREIWYGQQVISTEDRLFDYNTEGDIFYHGNLQDGIFLDPVLWVDAPLTVGKTWKDSSTEIGGHDYSNTTIHYVFAVLDQEIVTCPAGTFKCFRVYLSEIFPDGTIESCYFWYNDRCGLISCCLPDNSLYRLRKYIPGNSTAPDEEIHNPVPGEAIIEGLLGAPNPAKPMSSISFELKDAAQVEVGVFDISGRLVKRLVQGEYMSAGPVSIRWEGTDDQGRTVASGTYLFRIKAGQTVSTKRITLVR